MNVIETYRRTKNIVHTARLMGLKPSEVSAMIPYEVKQEVDTERKNEAKNFIPLKEYQVYVIAELYERGVQLIDLAKVFQVPPYHISDELASAHKKFDIMIPSRLIDSVKINHEPELSDYKTPDFLMLPPTTDNKAVSYMKSKF